MKSLHSIVNRSGRRKCEQRQPAVFAMENGSGGGTRTPDTRIMISHVALFLRDFSVNDHPMFPAFTDSARWSVNPLRAEIARLSPSEKECRNENR